MTLEQLPDRLLPSSYAFTITEVAAPAGMNSVAAAQVDTSILLFLGQFPALHLGVPYQGPNQIVRYDVTTMQWDSLMNGYPLTTARQVVWVLGGEVPLIFVPDAIIPNGASTSLELAWELTCYQQGWWYADPPTTQVSAIGPGPQHGQSFDPPNLLLCDALLAANDPFWWLAV